MAYIGNIPAEAYTNTVKDSFNGDGSTVAFTMSLPSLTNDVRVVVENVVQDPTVAYSCSGTTLTFTSAPVSGTANIYVVHLGAAVMTTIPPSEIADATVFASNVTVQGAFTSKGIDDNATSTAMTLDGSGNVLVGKTSSSGSTQGAQLQAAGNVFATVTNDYPLYLNRLGSDGTLSQFRKNGTLVGSIGVAGSELFIGSTSGTDSYLGFGADLLKPVTSTGAGRTGAISLGNANARFKDLYLSGGVYLGGTVAANKLDDFETGSFTPTFTNATSYSVAVGRYTKIGNLVYVNLNIICAFNNTGGTAQKVGGFPFAVSSESGLYPVGIIFPVRGFNQANVDICSQGNRTETSATLYSTAPSTGNNFTTVIANTFSTTVEFEFSMTYRTGS